MEQEHLKMHSLNIVDENIKKIAELFPNTLTEVKDEDGNIKQAIDFDVLKQELSDCIVSGKEERYQFTWPEKRNSILLANSPISETLRPCVEESLGKDGTPGKFDSENLYIEGDNLDVLKLLQQTYMNKIKMIYIDPPYNTGNDFVYEDDFSENTDEYLEKSGQFDKEGNKLVQNTESNGRYHTDWLNMIYPRLKIAKHLLTDDGLIFISINDIEVANLKTLCIEIFGERNFVADLIWANKEGGGSSDSKQFRIKHEHILCFAKNINEIFINGVPINNEERYKDSDEYENIRGKYYLQKLGMGSIQYSKSLDYPIEAPDGTIIMPADNNNGKKACWRWSKDKFDKNKALGFIEIKKDSKNMWTVYTKQYLKCDNEGTIIERTQRPFGIIDNYSSTQASKYLESIDLANTFNYSKPMELIRYLLLRINTQNSIIMDFFSGSATTAHAVYQQNCLDNGNRKFILVQLPEPCDENSIAPKKGFKNICEIGKERIRRAANKLRNENSIIAQEQDLGFRVLKLDSTNMKDIYYTPDEITQGSLDGMLDNIKEDRTPEDLLFQAMLELAIPLSSSIEESTIVGKKIFNVNAEDNYLLACFDSGITNEIITEIAKKKPYYFVMRDNSMANDSVAANFEQIFNTYSPDTKRKVL